MVDNRCTTCSLRCAVVEITTALTENTRPQTGIARMDGFDTTAKEDRATDEAFARTPEFEDEAAALHLERGTKLASRMVDLCTGAEMAASSQATDTQSCLSQFRPAAIEYVADTEFYYPGGVRGMTTE